MMIVVYGSEASNDRSSVSGASVVVYIGASVGSDECVSGSTGVTLADGSGTEGTDGSVVGSDGRVAATA